MVNELLERACEEAVRSYASALSLRGREARKRSGLPPFGFRVVPATVVPDPSEQATLARIRELREGGLSIEAIRDALNAEGRPARNGGRWHTDILGVIIRRNDIQGAVPPIQRCRRGHEFTPDNTYHAPAGYRQCRTCLREASRRRRRGEAAVPNGKKTHCIRGHEFTAENTYVSPSGRRRCETCRRERANG